MRQRELGSGGPEVGAVGFGAMSLSGVYGEADDAESVATLHAALDLGATLIDTADVYGAGHNERLVGRALRGRRDEAVLCTKFGFVDPFGGEPRVNGSPEHARRSIDASLEANAAAAEVELTESDLELLDEIGQPAAIAGDRYPPEYLRLVDG